MVNDEESRHALASEETPLLAESGIGETTASAGQNGYEDEDDVAPTPIAGKRAVVVAFAVVCLLFIQGMITESGRLPHGTNSFAATNITSVSTTQSDIAADLDAFSNTPWLTSSYMVCSHSLPTTIVNSY